MAAALLVAAGCGPSRHWEDILDAPYDVPPLPDAPVATATVVEHVFDAAVVPTAVGWAFGDGFHALAASASPTETDGRDLVMEGIDSGHLFVPSSCVSVEWTEGTTAEMTLSGCRLALTNEPVIGTMSIEVVLAPAALRVSSTDLSVAGLAMSVGIDLHPFAAGVEVLDVIASYTEDGRRVTVSGESATVSTGLEGEVGFGLRGTWDRDGWSGGLAVDLVWRPGECLPFQLATTFDGAPFQARTPIYVHEDTPSTGVVHADWMPITLRTCD